MLSQWHKQIWVPWKGKNEFFQTQLKMSLIILIAYLGDRYQPSYPRNDNHNMTAFGFMNLILLVLSAWTWTSSSSSSSSSSSTSTTITSSSSVPVTVTPVKITFLSREQTEEWKGWMQFVFIMYHYYRAFSAYNYIRVFVSSYVWMTGFGNYLYFEKTKDYSLERIISMVIRINYFPLLLCLFLGVPLELYYVVPLHTVGFFITMMTCYIAHVLDRQGYSWGQTGSRILAITLMACFHIVFFETNLVQILHWVFGKEISFRFQADKYSAWLGIFSAFFMKRITEFLTWAYGTTSSSSSEIHYGGTLWKISHISWIQRVIGTALILAWYLGFGYKSDKYEYNPLHPYVFILALMGYLMIRNSSKYLTEYHSTVLEFLGKNTLETYVLQFHLFMNHSVQYIPMILPYSDAKTGLWYMKFLNMVLCGSVFLTLSVWARKLTVSTQMTVVELWKVITLYRTTQVDEVGGGEEENAEEDSIKETASLISISKNNPTLEVETIELTSTTSNPAQESEMSAISNNFHLLKGEGKDHLV